MFKSDYEKKTFYFKQPAGTSRGTLHRKNSWFIHLWDDANPLHKGIGECSILPGLSPDDTDRLESEIQQVCEQINRYQNFEFTNAHQFPALNFALDMAGKDLAMDSDHVLFPSSFTRGDKGIPINGLIWMGDFSFMTRQVTDKLNNGFRCLKMKVGAIDFEEELNILRKLRHQFPAGELELRLDANGAFSVTNALEKLKKLSEFNIHSIEQPIQPRQPEKMNELCQLSPIPIALDEELIFVYGDKKRKLLEEIQPRIIILKPSLLGGFDHCEEWIDLAHEMNIDWWITSALESNVGLNAIAQWTCLLNKEGYHGLGTGQLFTNNTESPLYLKGEYLYFNPNKS
ncbi:MAG: o-succinylbenzoate synthase [Bacteroidetes bacterium]|jgi:o-succinylbenzoate synthase|nr:o-succinylbenzoate synthase [Bacteroidota bacterium]